MRSRANLTRRMQTSWAAWGSTTVPPPKFNSEFSPESHDGTGRRSGFLLGFGNFSGALAVKLREGKALIAGLREAGGFP